MCIINDMTHEERQSGRTNQTKPAELYVLELVFFYLNFFLAAK